MFTGFRHHFSLPQEVESGNWFASLKIYARSRPIWRISLGKKIAHDSVRSPIMNHPADFIIVVSSDEDHLNGYHLFAEKVNRKLRAGYQLHGQPFNIERLLCQAMVKSSGTNGANGNGFSESSHDTTTFRQRSDGLVN